MTDMETSQYRRVEDYGNVSIAQSRNGEYSLLTSDGWEIIPEGKYAWISPFEGGLARVRTKGTYNMGNNIAIMDFDDDSKTIEGKENIDAYYARLRREHPEQFSHWGIINMHGEEVVPTIYDEIWNFYKKGRKSTRCVKNGESTEVYFCNLPGSDSYVDQEPYDDYCYDFLDYESRCFDSEGNFDCEAYEDMVMDGLVVPDYF